MKNYFTHLIAFTLISISLTHPVLAEISISDCWESYDVLKESPKWKQNESQVLDRLVKEKIEKIDLYCALTILKKILYSENEISYKLLEIIKNKSLDLQSYESDSRCFEIWREENHMDVSDKCALDILVECSGGPACGNDSNRLWERIDSIKPQKKNGKSDL